MQSQDVGFKPPLRQRPSRSSSMGTDAPSLSSASLMPTLPSVHPPPAFVAASAASQFVTDAHLHELQSAEEPLKGALPQDSVLFSDAALFHINNFLDHLLFKFLGASQSPRLSPIQVAVENVLKGKLGRQALLRADTDLEALLDDEDEEQSEAATRAEDEGSSWDTEAYFRRTRLRIMVYMRLGEMEDEDEDEYIDYLANEGGERLGDLSEDDGLVTPSGAIFLTSILEYVAEVCLGVAGQAAYKRTVSKRAARSPISDSTSSSDQQVAVLESDVEKAGVDARLGRLWRSWKHKLRGNNFDHARNYSHTRSGHNSRKTSISTLRSDFMTTPTQQSEPPLPVPVEELREPNERPPLTNKTLDALGGSQEEVIPEQAQAVRIMRTSKQRPTSLNIPSRNKAADPSTGMTPEEERALQRRLRAQTLPSPGTVEQEATADDLRRMDAKINVTSAEPVEQFRELESSDDIPPRSPLPHALGSHPVQSLEQTMSADRGTADDELSPNIVDQARVVEIVRQPRTDSSSTDSPAISSARKTPAIDNELSPTSSPRTSLEDAESVWQNETSRSSETDPKAASSRDFEHSSVAMRLKNDGFPRLDTAFQTAPTTPSSAIPNGVSPFPGAVSPGPAKPSPSSESHQRGWAGLRKLSGASRRSRSNSRTSPANEVRRPSKETLASNHSGGSRGSKGEAITERPFSELIADRDTIRLKLTPKQLQQIEEPALSSTKEDAKYGYEVVTQSPSYGNAKTLTPTRTHTTSPIAEVPSPLDSPQLQSSAPRPSQNNMKANKAGLMPKEARVQTETMDDIAHFIRNTGPPQAPFNSSRPGSAKGTPRKTPSRRTSGEYPRSAPATKSTFEESVPPLPVIEPKKSRTDLTPREATTKKRSPNADLIEFLRAGPPPGTVTASQTAASNSSAKTNGRASDARSHASASQRSSSLMTQSAAGSINSYSPLLASPPSKSQVRGEPEHSSLHTQREAPAEGKKQYRNNHPYAMPSDDEMPQPSAAPGAGGKRQYRNKDPYALPSEDEDEDMITTAARPKPQKEESFVDFLKNTEPPSTGGYSASNGMPTKRFDDVSESRQPTNRAYVDQSASSNKLKKEKSGSMRTRIFGKKVGAS